jgi:hypothetical protein
MKNVEGIDPTQIESMVDTFLASETVDWRRTSDVWNLVGDLSEFEFIFSWVACGVILGCLGVSMMYFVSRVISIAILYIAAPFSIGASVLDDGARFKLWREQILIKFITGYGMMLAINIYAMICLLVMKPGLEFFGEGTFIDYLMKLLLIAGGGVSLKQSMALIGNLISNGAGSNELRDAAISGGLGGMIGKIPGAGILAGIGNSMKQEITGKAAQKILPSWAQRSYGGGKGGSGGGRDENGSDSKNSKSPAGGSKNTAKDAILGDGKGNDSNKNITENKDNKNDDNTNDKKVDGGGQGNNLVNNAINDTGKKSGGYDDLYDD